MSDVMITDGMKQRVITRLATINSATSILSLINGRPAKVSVDEVLALAECIERWAWRDLLQENTEPQRSEPPSPQAEPAKPRTDETAKLAPETTTAKSELRKPVISGEKPNGHSQWGGAASEKQINAIFAIGRSKGYDTEVLKGEITEKLGKTVMQLTSREASKLIDDLKAL